MLNIVGEQSFIEHWAFQMSILDGDAGLISEGLQ
jgi:hypothetical protein